LSAAIARAITVGHRLRLPYRAAVPEAGRAAGRFPHLALHSPARSLSFSYVGSIWFYDQREICVPPPPADPGGQHQHAHDYRTAGTRDLIYKTQPRPDASIIINVALILLPPGTKVHT
jgi:hypothetical protein